MTTALRNEPPLGPKDSDPRFGSGVPDNVRASGLNFIEMTGIPRPAWLRVDDSAETPQRHAETIPTASGEAAQIFQGLIDELSGVAPTNSFVEMTSAAIPTPLGDGYAVVAEAISFNSQPDFETRPELARSARSVVAMQALAEAEQLLHALDRLDAGHGGALPEETVTMLQQALAAAPDPCEATEFASVEIAETSDARSESAALEASLPPLEDFVQQERESSVSLKSTIDTKSPIAHAMTSERHAASLVSAPGYTVIGDGPITWPGLPMPSAQSRPVWAVALVVIAGLAAATACWSQVQPASTRGAIIEQAIGLWPQRPIWAALIAHTETAASSELDSANTAHALGLSGLLAVQEGRFADAAALFTRAKSATPSDTVLPLVLLRAEARALTKLGQGTAARESLRAALLLPENLSRNREYRALAEIAREEASTATTPEARRSLLGEAVAALRAALALPELSTDDRRELRKTIAWLDAELSPAEITP